LKKGFAKTTIKNQTTKVESSNPVFPFVHKKSIPKQKEEDDHEEIER